MQNTSADAEVFCLTRENFEYNSGLPEYHLGIAQISLVRRTNITFLYAAGLRSATFCVVAKPLIVR